MKKQFCGFCNAETWHNPLRKAGEYRCTQCGNPRRYGQKNYGVILAPGGKVIMQAKP